MHFLAVLFLIAIISRSILNFVRNCAALRKKLPAKHNYRPT